MYSSNSCTENAYLVSSGIFSIHINLLGNVRNETTAKKYTHIILAIYSFIHNESIFSDYIKPVFFSLNVYGILCFLYIVLHYKLYILKYTF